MVDAANNRDDYVRVAVAVAVNEQVNVYVNVYVDRRQASLARLATTF